ncbi:MAG TPA: preprotein translocase subunit YajC [Jiangellaceae bacterium]|nr:preprotein translocase subunit YajC [Jiangellaceae bacterium]
METLLLPILLLVVFYFLLIRPQQKQRRDIAQVQSTVAPGARIMTSAGLIGTVVAIEGDEVVLEVAPGVTNRYVRRAIVRVLDDGQPEQTTNEPATRPVDDTADDNTPGTSA